MSDKQQHRRGGVSFLGMLAILFIGLKLTGHIGWSWWWVTAPLWGPLAVVVAFLVVALPIALLIEAGRWSACRPARRR